MSAQAIFCKDSQSFKFEGAGDAGAHSQEVVLPAGRYSILIGGTAGGATVTAKLVDSSGTQYDVPNADNSDALTIPTPRPATFEAPSCTLLVAATGAGGSTAMTITIGRIDS